jgi:hypothetical protein
LQHQLISVGWHRFGLEPSGVPVKESSRSGFLELRSIAGFEKRHPFYFHYTNGRALRAGE